MEHKFSHAEDKSHLNHTFLSCAQTFRAPVSVCKPWRCGTRLELAERRLAKKV